MGTAWDFTHYRLHCLIYRQNPNDEIKSTNYYFVTKDRRLFQLISNLSLVTTLENDSIFGTPVLHSNMDYPKFKDSYREIENYLKKIQLARVGQLRRLDIALIKEQIIKLEHENNFA